MRPWTAAATEEDMALFRRHRQDRRSLRRDEISHKLPMVIPVVYGMSHIGPARPPDGEERE